MKSSEIFGIIVRTVGLLTGLNSAVALLAAALLLAAGELGQSLFFIVIGIPLLMIGCWMLRGAPELIDFAYRQEK